jgi:hypothetical protein
MGRSYLTTEPDSFPPVIPTFREGHDFAEMERIVEPE